MVQLLFFISMIVIVALMLNLFWYLEDSYKEENRFDNRQRCNSYSKRETTSSFPTMIRLEPIRSPRKITGNNGQFRINDYQNSRSRTPMTFYDVGTSEENLSYTAHSQNQSECA